jgi:Putative Flp pilus-assembly TadE/G-like
MKRDDGSTIPLILGFFIVALVMVAASVAAGDAFVQQTNLQSQCDAAAAVAASGADVRALRHTEPPRQQRYLQLAQVQSALDGYRARDDSRSAVTMTATLSPDGTVVTTRCDVVETIAFGSFFGFGAGIHHRATSSARAPLR